METGGGITAFPLGVIGDGAVNAEVGGEAVVVFTTSGGRSVAAFARAVPSSSTSTGSPSLDLQSLGLIEGQALTFDYQKDGGTFMDRETESTWDFAGRAQDGPLAGSRLERVSTRRSLWFAVAIAFPDVEIYQP